MPSTDGLPALMLLGHVNIRCWAASRLCAPWPIHSNSQWDQPEPGNPSHRIHYPAFDNTALCVDQRRGSCFGKTGWKLCLRCSRWHTWTITTRIGAACCIRPFARQVPGRTSELRLFEAMHYVPACSVIALPPGFLRRVLCDVAHIVPAILVTMVRPLRCPYFNKPSAPNRECHG